MDYDRPNILPMLDRDMVGAELDRTEPGRTNLWIDRTGSLGRSPDPQKNQKVHMIRFYV